MAIPEHVEVVRGGAKAIEKWREENPTEKLNLDGACFGPPLNLANADLSNALLTGTQFSGIDLSHANFSDAYFGQGGGNSKDSMVSSKFNNVHLRHANFCNAKDFNSIEGLDAKQLGGVNLKGVDLPDTVDIETLKSMADVSNHVKYTRNLFLTIIAVCMYSCISIWSASDINIIANNRGLNLPIINVSLPMISFFMFTPVVILAIYTYFLLYFQNLMERLRLAPAVFPDGKTLDEQADPWIVLSFVRLHLTGIERNGRDLWQYLLIVFLVWWLVPLTLLGFWYKYVIASNTLPVFFLIVCCILSSVLGMSFYRTSVDAITSDRLSNATSDKRIIKIHLLSSLGYLSLLILLYSSKHLFPYFWSVDMQYEDMRGMRLQNIHLAHANLTGADLSNASLKDSNLNNADLNNAKLSNADLNKVYLSEANLTSADLSEAHLKSAFLFDADLRMANLKNADLGGAYLSGASLSEADFSDTDLSNVNFYGAIVSSPTWDEEIKGSANNFAYDYWSVAEEKGDDGETIYVVVPPVEAKKP